MVQCIIFDLSEVLIAGLVGVETELSRELLVPAQDILPCFGGRLFERLLTGDISEDDYLTQVIARERWPIAVSKLKGLIRRNFHRQVDGSVDLLVDLVASYNLALLSDHAAEWVAYIRTIHPFLEVFDHAFFSYELKRTKQDPDTFVEVLHAMSLAPEECLFIDDSPANVRVAESVGIPGIRFVGAGSLAAELEEMTGMRRTVVRRERGPW
jgi:FMN phosphatase YigB (HAD superfamily)